jgi:hypothetical protein
MRSEARRRGLSDPRPHDRRRGHYPIPLPGNAGRTFTALVNDLTRAAEDSYEPAREPWHQGTRPFGAAARANQKQKPESQVIDLCLPPRSRA